MGAILADPEVLRLTGSVHSTAEINNASHVLDESTRSWYQSLAIQGDRLDLAIIDASQGICVGEVVLNDLSEADLSCNFRILIGAEGRNRGIGSDATRMILDYAFTSTPLHRVELEVYEFNPRAIRVYKSCGFIEEGRRREALRFDGHFIDSILMSVLRSERPTATGKTAP